MKQSARALLVTEDAVFSDRREQLVALAAQYKLPVIYPQREFAEKGGLASDADVSDQFRQAWLGALLVFVGVLQLAIQPIWRGRLSGTKRLRSGRDTLEPEEPGSGFGIKSNWPRLVRVTLGGAFLLAGAAI